MRLTKYQIDIGPRTKLSSDVRGLGRRFLRVGALAVLLVGCGYGCGERPQTRGVEGGKGNNAASLSAQAATSNVSGRAQVKQETNNASEFGAARDSNRWADAATDSVLSLSNEQENIQAAAESEPSSAKSQEAAQRTVDPVRERLRLAGLSPQQIEDLARVNFEKGEVERAVESTLKDEGVGDQEAHRRATELAFQVSHMRAAQARASNSRSLPDGAAYNRLHVEEK